MTHEWTWEYDPDAEHVIGGLPPEAVNEVARIADSLAVLGRDTTHVGRGPAHGGGLRSVDLAEGRGFLLFMADARAQLIVVVRVIWHG
ncbi:hypothetical protein ACFY1P_14190 [Streptomyces sp. NPDC001407]|uniref:hypothetical protein n=1 Tax=Streptomyces sp. NPDC001407 TaxID=3364573 RepID=UPI0036CFA5A0